MNPSREIYRIAMSSLAVKSLWGRGLLLLVWGIVSVYLGLATMELAPWTVSRFIIKISIWTLLITTPFLIGYWINKIFILPIDETIRSVPIRPSELFIPRIKAVVLTFLSIFAPVIIILSVAFDISNRYEYPDILERYLRTAAGSLLQFPTYAPLSLTLHGSAARVVNGDLVLPTLLRLPLFGQFEIIFLALGQWSGWLLFQILWGTYWRVKTGTSSAFWMTYISHLPIIALVMGTNYLRYNLYPRREVLPFEFFESKAPWIVYNPFHQGYLADWMWIIFHGLAGIIAAFILYRMTCMVWSRRK